MGQKTHPKGFRLVTTQKHSSEWYSSKQDYPQLIEEDFFIREKVTEVFVAPGNGGTEIETGCTNIDISSNDFPMIKSFVEENNVELVVVGPEDQLVNGLKDYLSDSNFPNSTVTFGKLS